MAKVAIVRELAERLYWKLREAAQPDAVGSRGQGSPRISVVDPGPSTKWWSALPSLKAERAFEKRFVVCR